MSASNAVALKMKSVWKNGIPELRMLLCLRNNLILFFSGNAANIFTVILHSKGRFWKRAAGFCTANVPKWGMLGCICGDIMSIIDARVPFCRYTRHPNTLCKRIPRVSMVGPSEQQDTCKIIK